MSELPDTPYIGIVQAQTWLATGEPQEPSALQDEAIAGLNKWKVSNRQSLLEAFHTRLSGNDAGDLGQLADRLAAQMDRPLGELANELHVEIVVGARRMAALNDAERLILDAALAQQITLDGQPYTPGESPESGVAFEPIPYRHFHLPVAINLFHGSISIAHKAPMEAYADWKGPDYANVRLSHADALKVAAIRDDKRASSINRAFDAAHWNQYQALAWVHTRSRELVAEFASGAERGNYWTEVKLPGGETRLVEESAPPPTMLEITLRTADPPQPGGRLFLDSKRELLHALSEGKVVATGLRNNTGDRTVIPAADWIDLEFSDWPAVARPSDLLRHGATTWHDVRFSRADVLQVWPDTASPTAPKIQTAALPTPTQTRLSPANLERAVMAYKATLQPDVPVTEKSLKAALDDSLGKPVPRDTVRALRNKHFGKAPMGRPKKSRGD